MTFIPEHQNWIFGYGSLMWRPGFEFIDSCPAKLEGFRRSLCVFSHVHRGTPDVPGLVFGLDNGGYCHGFAFQIAEKNWNHTIDYLRQREQVTAVYIESRQEITLTDRDRTKVNSVTYLVDHTHKQYAGSLPHDELLKFIRQGKGQSGHCRDYVLAADEHLRQLGVNDTTIHALAKDLCGDRSAS